MQNIGTWKGLVGIDSIAYSSGIVFVLFTLCVCLGKPILFKSSTFHTEIITDYWRYLIFGAELGTTMIQMLYALWNHIFPIFLLHFVLSPSLPSLALSIPTFHFSKLCWLPSTSYFPNQHFYATTFLVEFLYSTVIIR